ncbi:MAG: flavodoxin family protein [Candidatus Levyibacteriota bacterium]
MTKGALAALIINCTLSPSPKRSNTEALAMVVKEALEEKGVTTEMIRAVDHMIKPGVSTDEGEGDEWPPIHDKIVKADILVMASPTWMGQPSSVAKRVLERMDALLSEKDNQGRFIAFNKVAGFVVTGNEDGAHHVIGELAIALIDTGFTVPGQAWTYWNKGPGPGKSYLETDYRHDWSIKTGKSAAHILVSVANALKQNPIPPQE